MDKLKIFLAVAKKYQFWVFCGVMLLTSLGCWWWATGSLTAQFRTRKSLIDSDFSGTNVPPDPANNGVIDDIKRKDEALKQKVYSAWETLYAEQKQNNPFPPNLGEDFKKQFESLQLPKGQLDSNYLDIYQNFIKDYLPTLENMISARHEVKKPTEGPAGGEGRPVPPTRGVGREGYGMGRPRSTGGGSDTEKEYTGIVDWDDYNQLLGHFDWPEAPSTLDVVLAQEDLWVYEAILRIIKNVNEGATNHDNAPIKRIEALEIGKDAYKAWTDPKEKESVVRMGKGGGPAAGPADRSAMPGHGPMGTSGGSSSQPERQLVEFRYVDEKGEPLPFDPEYPYAKHPFPEFKMMPIRMRLTMDQRHLPKLLVELANSNMPIKVRRVRVLKVPQEALELGGSPTGPARSEGGGMGAMGRPSPHGPSPDMGRPSGQNGLPRGTNNSTTQETTGESDAPVEIYAVIYIYWPPNREKLGMAPVKDPAGTAAPSAPTTQPTPPATLRK